MRKTVNFLLLILALALNGCERSAFTTITATVSATENPSQTRTAIPPTLTPMPEGKTILVTSANDNGDGTLRQAMQDANPYDLITFDSSVFPPNNPASIALSAGLPEMSQGNLILDARDAGVILDGSAIQEADFNALMISSNGNVVRGIQIVNFTGNGITLFGGARDNTIGGDDGIGSGPTGQANMISGTFRAIVISDASHNLIIGNYLGTDSSGTTAWGNGTGIHMNGGSYNKLIGNLVSASTGYGIELCCTANTNNNLISGNLVGTAIDGKTPLGNQASAIAIHDGASFNTVGPDNLIAFNQSGISIFNDSLGNTITRNRIYSNSNLSIDVQYGSETQLVAPQLVEYDLKEGTVFGWSCPGCVVELFSDNQSEGAQFEGEAKTDSLGVFTFIKGSSFTGPNLTAIATDSNRNSSEFSTPVTGVSLSGTFQEGNISPKLPFQSLQSVDLTDNHIGAVVGWPRDCQVQYFEDELFTLGAKWVKLSINEIEPESVLGNGIVSADWGKSEFSVSEEQEKCIEALLDNGFTITYILSFWDKANHPEGWEPSISRFRTQEEIDRYLDFVRFIVQHFKGRIRYYEIWNEPNNKPPLQWIQLTDYINLVKQTIPVIKQEDPDAKIVIGGIVLQNEEDRRYLFGLLKSDLMELVDVVSWHAMFGVSPESSNEYYYGYSDIVQSIRMEAEAHGFTGEYWADELIWRDPDCYWCFPGDPIYSNIVSAKYHARGIVIQLGMGLNTQVTGNSSVRPNMFSTIKNLATLMAGNKPLYIPMEIQSTATLVKSYGFSMPDGNRVLAIWNDGVAIDSDPGIPSTIILPDLTGWTATAIDVLIGLQQDLITGNENGDLIIRDFHLKDYPLIIWLSK